MNKAAPRVAPHPAAAAIKRTAQHGGKLLITAVPDVASKRAGTGDRATDANPFLPSRSLRHENTETG